MISNNTELQGRLKNLQNDIQNGNTGWFANNLKAIDVILLLKYDVNIQNILREILTSDSDDKLMVNDNFNNIRTKVNSVQYNPISEPDMSLINQPIKNDSLRNGLLAPLTLIIKIKQDEELFRFWLEGLESEADELMTILIKLGNYEEISRLHDWLKERCKSRKSAITEDEKFILETALALHNKSYKSKNATLDYIQPNQQYDHKIHDRGNADSDKEMIKACWLPALKNAAGKLTNNAVVELC